MDSLTQIVLGAACGEIVLGRKLGNKAQLLGAIAGTIPDLDVVSGFFTDGPVAQLTYHRAYSHSFPLLAVLAYGLTWLSRRWSKAEVSTSRWFVFWLSGLWTHVLLDCCTTYGTRALLPFTDYQVAFNNISVVDPLYTVPFLLVLGACLFFRRDRTVRRRLMWISIGISSAYMATTFVLKAVVHEKFETALAQQGISSYDMDSTPTIFNAILWSGVARTDHAVYCAEYSFLRPELPVYWVEVPREREAASGFDSPDIEKVEWFADGTEMYRRRGDDSLFVYNGKFGRFNFESTNPDSCFWPILFVRTPAGIEAREVQPDFNVEEAFGKLMERIGL